MGDPTLHGRQPLPLEQPQQARRGGAVRAANAVEPANAVKAVNAVNAVKATEDVTAAARRTVATVTLGVLSTVVTAVTLGVLGTLVALVAVAGQAVVRVVAGVHRPPASPAPARQAGPGRSVCILSFTMQSPGRVVHRQGAASATGAEIA
ncbi:hypothetical protein [Microbispora bryophytorum]|uniref:hypothetical protein n=1 Tax=Microbispora bryophytorum TaxID=1460882 RepID=UPI0033DC2433